MPDPAPHMKPWSKRPLTAGERAMLSAGLCEALDAAGASPVIHARPSAPALVAALWRKRPPVMVLGQGIFWPGALIDFASHPRLMPVLQHELQHVLEFRTGELTRLGYVLRPRNWTYRYRIGPDAAWSAYGAEQRAQMVQDYWLANRQSSRAAEELRRIIPWAA